MIQSAKPFDIYIYFLINTNLHSAPNAYCEDLKGINPGSPTLKQLIRLENCLVIN